MPLEGLRWSRDSGSALYDTPPNGRSRTGWGGVKRRKMMMKRRKEIKMMKQIMMKQMRIERGRRAACAGSRFSQASTSGVTTMDTRILQ